MVFSDDWGEHPSSCQHIFKYIVREYPVIWVNTVGMRLPRLNRTDALKAVKKLKKMFWTTSASTAPRYSLPDKLTVLQPIMVPYNKGPFRSFNKRSVVKAVKAELDRRGLQNPILVTTVPNACDYLGAFGEKKIVYYCVDDFANWPGHETAFILEMEQRLIEKADLFIATSKELFNRLAGLGKPIYLLPHGVDLEAFLKAPDEEHEALVQIPRPRLGYVGLIDARLDWDLLSYLLERLPEVSFVFVGRCEQDLSRFRRYSNFYHLSPVPYKEVPQVLKSMDILLLPYLVNSFTETINPLKLKEYLASGRKVIGSPLREIKQYASFLKVAYGPEEWLSGLRLLLAGKEEPVDCSSLLLKEAWAYKAQEFLEICLKV
ncbi:glycosyltransferase family 1 protein [Thermosulfuriphilus sp.]